MMKVTHDFAPVFNEESRVLMLGTMPSPKSRETGFYYGHPRNRFWKVVSDVCGEELPVMPMLHGRTRSRLRFAIRSRCGTCWRDVRSKVRTTAVSAIRCRMI